MTRNKTPLLKKSIDFIIDFTSTCILCYYFFAELILVDHTRADLSLNTDKLKTDYIYVQ